MALGYCTDVHISRAYADQLGFPFVDLSHKPPTQEALRLLPRSLAQRCGAVPVEVANGRLTVVARNPLDFTIDSTLRQAVGMPIHIVCGVDSQIQKVLEHWDRILLGLQGSPDTSHLPHLHERLGERRSVLDIATYTGDAPPSVAVSGAINQLLREGAEEIQITIKQNTLRVTGSVEGQKRCLAFIPGEDLQIVIRSNQRLPPTIAQGEVPFQVTLEAA